MWSVTSPTGEKVGKATVWIGVAPSEPGVAPCASFSMAKASPMYLAVHGIAALLEARQLRMLNAMVQRQTEGMAPTGETEVLYTVSLCATTEVRRVEILACPDGSVWCRIAASARAAAGEPVSLDRQKFASFAQDWIAFTGRVQAGPTEESPDRPARRWELDHPYVASPFKLDRATLSERFLRGRPTQIPAADRVLELESLFVRTPKNYTSAEPAGLLVWVDAGNDGKPPECMNDALDAANIVAAGFARSGNERPVANRYQLALDAVATISRRLHIDPRRVYISGISGGGRVSSIMVGCFPDVFTGAIPIVGLSCSEATPVATRGYVPAAYARPQGRLMDLFQQRRIGAITGSSDFNQPEMTAAAQILRGQGVPAKLFEYLGMGHQLPTPERFAEALTWVDEPWRKLYDEEVKRGERELKAALLQIKGGDDAPSRLTNDAQRARLMRVTELAPWTPAAWRAISLLDDPQPTSGASTTASSEITGPQAPETPPEPAP